MKPPGRTRSTTRQLVALSLSIALAMSGVGLILPVVPSHIEHLGLANASTAQVALHVSLLAAGCALMQLLLAPLWGRLSDSLGRRPLLAIGLIGFAAGQALCGVVTSLSALYAVRLGTGLFSASIIPAAFAYVADTTCDEDRTRGMAQLSAAAGIGFVIGPAIGGLLGGIDVHAIELPVASFSLPFFAAAGCALLALFTLRWLEEPVVPAAAERPAAVGWLDLARRIGLPLAVAMAGQVSVSLFETTFALHARTDLGMGLVGIGVVFMVCGPMMLVVQIGALAPLARRWGEARLASAALALMGLILASCWLWRWAAPASSRGSPCTQSGWGLSPRQSRRSCPGVAARMRARGCDSKAGPRAWARSRVPCSAVFSSALPWPFPIPFWLASGSLLGLAPIFAWTAATPSGRAMEGAP